MKNVWSLHQEKCNTFISADHTKAGLNGVIKVYHCLTFSVNKSIIQDSFRLTGSHPMDNDQIIAECTATIPRDQLYIDYYLKRNQVFDGLYRKRR